FSGSSCRLRRRHPNAERGASNSGTHHQTCPHHRGCRHCGESFCIGEGADAMSMRQLRARLEKLEEEQAKRIASEAADPENKESRRYYELWLKPKEQRTPEEQEELSKLSLTLNKPLERKPINIKEDPGYSVIMAFDRVVKEEEEEAKRSAARWRARQAAKGGRETKG